jgi:AAA+ ATPase superfamily predicted ATPase
MRFYDRNTELSLLSELSKRAEQFAQFTSIIGRRRVGKTELVRQHLKDAERGLYFFVEKRPSQALLIEFSECLKQSIPHAPIFSDWKDFFVFLFAEAQRQPLVAVFDEFQNFLSVEPAVYSILQGVWDEWHNRSKIHLIVIGSVVGLMKRVFQDTKEPLYGRLTQEINITPLPLESVFQICSELGFTSTEDILTLYGIFGGMPRYYELIESMGLGGKSVREILQKALFSSFAPFRNEVREIILSEFGGNSYTYIAILEAIATGKTRLSEIAGPAGIPATSLSKYMRELSDIFELVQREVPVTEKSWKSKKSRYKICDPFLTFWMQFVYRQLSIYEAGNYQYFLEKLDTYLAEFMGFAFEEIIKELLQTLNLKGINSSSFLFDQTFSFRKRKSLEGKAPISFHRIGRWWDRQKEIDLVALNQDTGDALFVECKWTSKEIHLNILHELMRKSEDVPPTPGPSQEGRPVKKERCFYLLASKNGFSSSLRQVQDDNIFLWDMPYITTLIQGLL